MEIQTNDPFTLALQKQEERENGTKVCVKCGQTKPYREFSVNRKSKDGFQSYCIPCQREAAQQRAAKNKSLQQEVKTLREKAAGNLSKYEPRELIDELKRRGYHGTLCYKMEVKL